MPTFEIQSPEGQTFEIEAPDGATQDQAFEFFKQEFSAGRIQPTQAAPAAPTAGLGVADVATAALNPVNTGLKLLNHFTSSPSDTEDPGRWGGLVQGWKDATRGAVQGATAGLSDEIAGGVAARQGVEKQLMQRAAAWLQGEELPADAKAGLAEVYGEKYNEERDATRAADAAASERNPVVYTTGEIAGGIATSLPLMAGGAPVTMTRLLGEGAVVGGVAGAGFSEAETAEEILVDAAMGATIGAAAGPALKVVGAAARPVTKRLGRAFSASNRKSVETRFVNARARSDAYQAELGLNPIEAASRAAADLRLSPDEFTRRAVPALKLKGGDDPLTRRVLRESGKIRSGLAKTGGRTTNLSWIRGLHESVEKMSARFGGRLRRYESGTQLAIRDQLLEGAGDQSLNLLGGRTGRLIDSAVHKGFRKMAKPAQAALRVAMANGDEAGVDAALVNAPDAVQGLVSKWRQVRGEYAGRVREAGHDINLVDGYYPRVWKDSGDLRTHYLGKGIEAKKVDSALKPLTAQYGDDIPMVSLAEADQQLSAEVARRGKALSSGIAARAETARLGPTSQLKARTRHAITEKDLESMLDPFESMAKYVQDVEANLQKRALFGLTERDVAGSLGRLMQSELDNGWITPNEAKGLQDLLQTRFINGERNLGKKAQRVRNVTSVALLGNPVSALTQIGDIAVSAGYNGWVNTLRGLLGPKTFDRMDIGVMDVAAELADSSRSRALVDDSLRVSGFKKLDSLGKNTHINAALLRLRNMSKSTRGQAEIRKKYKDSMSAQEMEEFLVELGKSRKEIKAGQNELVKFALFNELSNVQPISLSEMPVKYLEMVNGRLMYQMRTFSLKQMELFRKEFIQKMKTDPAAAGKFALRYGAATSMLTGAVDMAKDAVTGKFREPDYDPLEAFGTGGLESLMMSAIGINKFTADQVLDGDPRGAISTLVMPASVSVGAGVLGSVIQGKPERALRVIPFVGPFYRWVLED